VSHPNPAQPGWLAIPRPDEITREPEPGPCTCDASQQEVVYTLHFDPRYKPSPDAPPYKSAGHYTGHAYDLEDRLAKHEAGRGARLTQVQKEAGGSWRLADVQPGDRNLERRLKQHSAARRCPICKAEAQATTPERELEAGL
jgi:predicted GIY-YIG superfamily endonuclease